MGTDHFHTKDKIIAGYHKMMQRIKEALPHGSEKALSEHINNAKEKAIQLGELSQEEAQQVGDYLQRDLKDAAHYTHSSQQTLADWMRFDLQLVEERLLELFSLMVDHTQMELHNLAERARQATEWNSGEITGPGSLYCASCGKAMHFHQPDYIPPCPNCGGRLFKRYLDENEA